MARNTCNQYWCDFCNALEITGDIGKTVEFEKYLGDLLPSRTIFETEHFAVIASLGQIVEGYLLILSKEHYPSMAHIPEKYHSELASLHQSVRSILTKIYAPSITFEHGPMPINSQVDSPAEGGGSCVDHAHLHVLPFPFTVDHLIPVLKGQFSWRQIHYYNELKLQVESNTPYFFVETQDGSRYVFDATVAQPQYLRRVLASLTNAPERWNWRLFPETERIVATVKRLRAPN